jgi:hypothetical protein
MFPINGGKTALVEIGRSYGPARLAHRIIYRETSRRRGVLAPTNTTLPYPLWYECDVLRR